LSEAQSYKIQELKYICRLLLSNSINMPLVCYGPEALVVGRSFIVTEIQENHQKINHTN